MSRRPCLDAALAYTDLREVTVTERQVDSDADAKRWGMRGSPTILIDGDDPFGTEADEPSMSCRLYAGGAPTVADLAAALRHGDHASR